MRIFQSSLSRLIRWQLKEDTAIGHALFLLIACDIEQKQHRDNVNICLYVHTSEKRAVDLDE